MRLISFFSLCVLLIQTNCFGGVIIASYSSDYSDIIFYHDCDAKDSANKAGGSSTVTYTANWDLVVATHGGSAIQGTDSWDQDNDGFDNAPFETSGNIDFSGGRLGFYFRPQEQAAGRMCFTNGSDFTASWLTPDDLRVVYMGTTIDVTTANFSNGTTVFMEFKFVGTAITIYVNGSAKASGTGSGTPDDSTISIGAVDGNAWDAHYDQIISSNDENRDLYAVRDITDFS